MLQLALVARDVANGVADVVACAVASDADNVVMSLTQQLALQLVLLFGTTGCAVRWHTGLAVIGVSGVGAACEESCRGGERAGEAVEGEAESRGLTRGSAAPKVLTPHSSTLPACNII